MPPLLIATLIAALAQAGLGLGQTISASKKAKRNIRPQYEIDPTYQNILDRLINTQGIPRSVMDMLYNRQGQAQSESLNTLQGYNANPNLIAQVLQGGYKAKEDIALQDAMVRKQDIAGINQAQLMLAEQNDKAFQINKLAPHLDLADALDKQKRAGWQNIGGAFNTASAGFATAATDKLANEMMKMSQGGGNMGGDAGGAGASVTTPGVGVNVNKIYQQYYGNRQSPLVNSNNMTIGNIGQAPRLDFANQIPFNMNNPFQYFSEQSSYAPGFNYGNPSTYFSQYPYFNPNAVSLFNNPYSLSF